MCQYGYKKKEEEEEQQQQHEQQQEKERKITTLHGKQQTREIRKDSFGLFFIIQI